jgi:alkanesulfonate monooxygenase SsuD/methylene tetrahydromethanopterin reductase-like flavin-dependent oxidoreductase (luciferase family)
MQAPPGQEHENTLRFLRRIQQAEAVGFDSVWLGERHFTGYGSIGNPLVFAGAVAAATSTIKIGFAAIILALHNPYQLAEELAMLDNLSSGRVLVGAGTGRSQKEYEGLGLIAERETRRERFDEILSLLYKVWEGKPFSHSGPFYPAQFPGMRLTPYQKPHPTVYRAIVHDESIVDSGKAGIPILLGRFAPEVLRRNLDLYEATLRECGGSGAEIAALVAQSGSLRHMVVTETDDEAEEIARNGLLDYIDRANEVFEPHEYEPFRAAACIAGSPETVIREIAKVRAVGVGRILCWFDFGGLDPDVADRSLKLFGEHVLPAIVKMQ